MDYLLTLLLVPFGWTERSPPSPPPFAPPPAPPPVSPLLLLPPLLAITFAVSDFCLIAAKTIAADTRSTGKCGYW